MFYDQDGWIRDGENDVLFITIRDVEVCKFYKTFIFYFRKGNKNTKVKATNYEWIVQNLVQQRASQKTSVL